jgi:hypothetical protein
MNIHHLVGKQVTVVHITETGVQSVFNGKLERSADGMYFVFAHSFWLSLMRFLLGKKDSVIRFPWHAVTGCEGNMVCLVDLTEEQMEEELRRAGVEIVKEDKKV